MKLNSVWNCGYALTSKVCNVSPFVFAHLPLPLTQSPLPSGFRHECTDHVLKMRAKNFTKMRMLVKKDRLVNDETAEPIRRGTVRQQEQDLLDNERLARSSGAAKSESDDASDAQSADL